MSSRLEFVELTSLQKHDFRYSDKYMNKARLDALYWRMRCYECGQPVFQYDPEDEDYIKCRHCGARKRSPVNLSEFTPEWGKDQRRKDGFKWLLG